MKEITTSEAIDLLNVSGKKTFELLNTAHQIRLKNRGLNVNLCGIVNAKSGHCGEDCKFCAQSSSNDATISCYPLMNSTQIFDAAKISQNHEIKRFGIVTSGLALENSNEVENVADSIDLISKKLNIAPCASLGNISEQTLLRLKKAGLTRYHCNLETAKSFYPQICTTRRWEDSAKTIETAKKIGLKTCSGGLFGLGESIEQRVELLDQLRQIDPDSVPINFLNPVAGTSLEYFHHLSPMDCLKIIAVARIMMPTKEIRVCGGREHNLGELQSWSLLSGADGLMIGGYLTTTGRKVADDLKMIKDAGFTTSVRK